VNEDLPRPAEGAAAEVPAATVQPTITGDPATLRTVARFARWRADALLAAVRKDPVLTNKKRLLASGAIGEARDLADVLDGLAVKAEEGGAA
jgi:hypothetical protein